MRRWWPFVVAVVLCSYVSGDTTITLHTDVVYGLYKHGWVFQCPKGQRLSRIEFRDADAELLMRSGPSVCGETGWGDYLGNGRCEIAYFVPWDEGVYWCGNDRVNNFTLIICKYTIITCDLKK